MPMMAVVPATTRQTVAPSATIAAHAEDDGRQQRSSSLGPPRRCMHPWPDQGWKGSYSWVCGDPHTLIMRSPAEAEPRRDGPAYAGLLIISQGSYSWTMLAGSPSNSAEGMTPKSPSPHLKTVMKTMRVVARFHARA